MSGRARRVRPPIHPPSRSPNESNPPARSGRLQIGSPGRHRLEPFPAFPASVRLAVVVGQPSESAPYVIRVKVPGGVKLMPHAHPEDRVYTVISGVFYIGLGDHFDDDKLQAYPPGSVIVLPGDTYHFHWAKSGEYVSQVTAIGPLGLEYLDPNDDPRNNEGQG
jgi:quercetin dioxygenase-like cupin family protein